MEAVPPPGRRSRRAPVTLLLAASCLAAVWRLANELPRGLVGRAEPDGIDVGFFHTCVHAWLGGEPVYGEVVGCVHPPATYTLLAPLLAPLSFPQARVAWAGLSLVGLAALAVLGLRGSALREPRERALLVLLLLGAYPASAALRVGQPGPWMLPLAVGAVALVAHRPARADRDVLAGALLCASLVKPTVTAPFVPLAWAVSERLRPVALCAGAYAGMTLLAGAVRGEDPVAVSLAWLDHTAIYASAHKGHAHLHRLLAFAGVPGWQNPASLLVLAGLAAFLWRRRRAHPWTLLGVTAIAARLWAHHRVHDDLLVWVAFVPLARIARDPSRDAGRARTAEVLFGANALLLLGPARILEGSGGGALGLELTQSAAWLGTALWLGRCAGRESRRAAGEAP